MSLATDDDKAISEHLSPEAAEQVRQGAMILPPPPSMLLAAKQQAQVSLLRALARAANNYDRPAANTFGQALQQVMEIK